MSIVKFGKFCIFKIGVIWSGARGPGGLGLDLGLGQQRLCRGPVAEYHTHGRGFSLLAPSCQESSTACGKKESVEI